MQFDSLKQIDLVVETKKKNKKASAREKMRCSMKYAFNSNRNGISNTRSIANKMKIALNGSK